MRIMLAVLAVHDDAVDAVDVEAAATDVWLEFYPDENADPVETVIAGAAVLDRDGIDALVAAMRVGSDGLPDHYTSDAADAVLTTIATVEDTADRLYAEAAGA